MKLFNKLIKKMDALDIGLIKFSTAAFVLFILALWPKALAGVGNIHWLWFLIFSIIFAIRPLKKVLYKK
jgi:hypothetical protein